MISLSDSLVTAAGLLGLSAAATPARTETDPPLPDFPFLAGGRIVSSDEAPADDPFFLAVAEALREAGYLDS